MICKSQNEVWQLNQKETGIPELHPGLPPGEGERGMKCWGEYMPGKFLGGSGAVKVFQRLFSRRTAGESKLSKPWLKKATSTKQVPSCVHN